MLYYVKCCTVVQYPRDTKKLKDANFLLLSGIREDSFTTLDSALLKFDSC